MKFLLGSFQPHMNRIDDPKGLIHSGLLPPLSSDGGRVEIDYSLLLISEKLLFDEYSFTRILDSKDSIYKNLRESLRVLKDEEFLELVNLTSTIENCKNELKTNTSAITYKVPLWIQSFKDHVKSFEETRTLLKEQFGNKLSDFDLAPYGIFKYLYEKHGKIEYDRVKELERFVLKTNKRKRTKKENEMLMRLIIPSIEVVLMNILLSKALGAKLYNWTTLNSYYKMLLPIAAEIADEKKEKYTVAQKFFTIAFPTYKPQSPSRWIKLLRHKHVCKLRDKIDETTRLGINIDPRFAQECLKNLIKTNQDIERLKKINGWISIPTSFIGGIAGGAIGGFTGGILGSLTPALAVEYINKIKSQKMMREHDWLYFTTL